MIDRLDTCNPDREESAGKPTNNKAQLPNGKAMTREEIIRIAREAGFADGVVDIVGFEGFAKFANLVAAHEREECVKMCAVLRKMAIEEEREECAKVCEAGVVQTNNWDASDWNQACKIRAAAIRKRGEK
jgi:hypothetical protein